MYKQPLLWYTDSNISTFQEKIVLYDIVFVLCDASIFFTRFLWHMVKHKFVVWKSGDVRYPADFGEMLYTCVDSRTSFLFYLTKHATLSV